MSSRRKSSNPCMVRVISDQPSEQAAPEKVMDIEKSVGNITTPKEQSETSESTEKRQQHQENVDKKEQGTRVETQTLEPSVQEEQSLEDHVIENVGDTGLKNGFEPQPEQVTDKKQPRGYECKYCPFSTQNLNDFKEHVDSQHPNVILNPLYLCAMCDFNTKKFDSLTEHNESRHPGETNFKFRRIKRNNQTILEQTIAGKDNSIECEMTNEQGDGSTSSVPCVSTTVKPPGSIQALFGGADIYGPLESFIQKNQIPALNINGTVIIPEPSILQGLSHVTPMLQRPPNFNCVPKIAVPLNTTKYNPSLDDNLTLIASFNKFPYPTHAELSWLTAASKHPEEQIKVWFTTQRLKQGITWSPEEVEEARKKMFNGSIPASQLAFSSTICQFSTKASKKPIVHMTVEHPGRRITVSNDLSAVTTTNSHAGVSHVSSHSLKRSLPTHLTSVLGPESKRPIMAVAPHSGDPKDKVLMAPPPPPPPPPKDRLSMAKAQVPVEIKRPGAIPSVNVEMKRSSVPSMPPPSSTLSSSSSFKGKILSTTGNSKTKPVVSIPSIVFPESLTRPMIAPPPIYAPPFKNSLLIPRTATHSSKEKHTSTLPELNLPNSPPQINTHVRRPTIIQSVRAPAKIPAQIQGFPLDGKNLKEQSGLELNAGFPMGDKLVRPLKEANGTSLIDEKLSQDQLFSPNNNGVAHLEGAEAPAVQKLDFQQKPVMTQFPLLERMKGKSAKQLKILEENFLKNSFPSNNDLDNLAANTGLSHQEISSWFVERRALRDNLEQALLNSMGTKKMGIGCIAGMAEQQQPEQTLHLNGIHKTSVGMNNLKSPPQPSHALSVIPPSTMAPSIPNPNPCSVPPDSRSLALLKDDFAQTRWPSPEELGQLEGRAGLPHADFARWFTDARLQHCNTELAELFYNNGLNGGQGHPVCSPERAPSKVIQRCQEGGVPNSSKTLEAELGWLMEQRPSSLQQRTELHERFAGRLRQTSVAAMKSRAQNGGVAAGAHDLFGSWLDDRVLGRGPLLDRDRKRADDTPGRVV